MCLSISDFHPKSFNPAWEVSTILLGVLSFMTSEEMTTGSVSATEAERKVLAARTRWWNSTGGGSTKRTLAGESGEAQAQQGASGGSGRTGFGAIKAGDGGQRFKEQWPEEDEENWKWMETEKIDPQTGRSLVLQQQVQAQEAVAAAARPAETTNGRRATIDAAPQSWLSKNKWYIVAAAVFATITQRTRRTM